MLNEEKIRLMTGIAMFEKKMMKESIPANRYFKSDYVGSHLIRSFIAYSLTVCLCLVLWVLYRFDDLLNVMAVDDLSRGAPCILLCCGTSRISCCDLEDLFETL